MSMFNATKVTTNWMNPLNKLRWQVAIKARAPQVTMLDGSKFVLAYSGAGHKGSVFFKPISTSSSKALVPRGTFDIETVLSDDWLDDDAGN